MIFSIVNSTKDLKAFSFTLSALLNIECVSDIYAQQKPTFPIDLVPYHGHKLCSRSSLSLPVRSAQLLEIAGRINISGSRHGNKVSSLPLLTVLLDYAHLMRSKREPLQLCSTEARHQLYQAFRGTCMRYSRDDKDPITYPTPFSKKSCSISP